MYGVFFFFSLADCTLIKEFKNSFSPFFFSFDLFKSYANFLHTFNVMFSLASPSFYIKFFLSFFTLVTKSCSHKPLFIENNFYNNEMGTDWYLKKYADFFFMLLFNFVVCLNQILQSFFDHLLPNWFLSNFVHKFIVDDNAVMYFQGWTSSRVRTRGKTNFWEKLHI